MEFSDTLLDENGQVLCSSAGRVLIFQRQKDAERSATALGVDPQSSVIARMAFVLESRGRKPKATSDFTVTPDSNEARYSAATRDYVLMKPGSRPLGFKSQRPFVERHFGPVSVEELRQIMKEIHRRCRSIEAPSK